MMTIEVKINGRLIALSTVRNISELADVSDYVVMSDEMEAKSLGIPHHRARFKIKGHNRNQSAWALVEKVAKESQCTKSSETISQS